MASASRSVAYSALAEQPLNAIFSAYRFSPSLLQVKSRVTKEEGSMDGRMRKFKDHNVPWDANALADLKTGSLMLVGGSRSCLLRLIHGMLCYNLLQARERR